MYVSNFGVSVSSQQRWHLHHVAENSVARRAEYWANRGSTMLRTSRLFSGYVPIDLETLRQVTLTRKALSAGQTSCRFAASGDVWSTRPTRRTNAQKKLDGSFEEVSVKRA